MIYLIGSIFLISFVIGFIRAIIGDINANKPPAMVEYLEDENADIIHAERLENYDRQIDGYTQLIKLLDMEFIRETDDKKRAAILSKQLLTLEKLNKTIEKREKLE